VVNRPIFSKQQPTGGHDDNPKFPGDLKIYPNFFEMMIGIKNAGSRFHYARTDVSID